MINPYQASDDASAVQKPQRIRQINKDAISLTLALTLFFASPIALLAAYLLLQRDPPIPNGVWPDETMNDYILQAIGNSHLILGLTGIGVIWLYHSKIYVKIILTLLALASVFPMGLALLCVTLEKTNKWL